MGICLKISMNQEEQLCTNKSDFTVYNLVLGYY
jgi:hypothetical protein